jgi:hypothetical protein
MTKDLNDCMAACQTNDKCEAVVYYEAELKGSCVVRSLTGLDLR